MTVAADPVAAAFLADIIAHPAEDAPRLIYADWLDDHGQADRAEFIRLQIELPQRLCDRHHDHTGHPACRCRFCFLRRRQDELFRGVWDAEVVPPSWTESFRWPAPVYRRGFMAVMTLPCADWERHGPALVRAAPLEVVRLSDRTPCRVDGERRRYFWEERCLPAPLYARLPSDDVPPGVRPHWKRFPSRDAAESALSAAALAWASATPPGDPPP